MCEENHFFFFFSNLDLSSSLIEISRTREEILLSIKNLQDKIVQKQKELTQKETLSSELKKQQQAKQDSTNHAEANQVVMTSLKNDNF